jgi:hypothetical protein
MFPGVLVTETCTHFHVSCNFEIKKQLGTSLNNSMLLQIMSGFVFSHANLGTIVTIVDPPP